MSSPVARTHKWIKVNLKPKVKDVLEENQRGPKEMKEDNLYQRNHKGVIQRLVDRAIKRRFKRKKQHLLQVFRNLHTYLYTIFNFHIIIQKTAPIVKDTN